MKKTYLSTIAVAAFALAVPLQANAGAESGIYLGFGVGDTAVDGSIEDDDLDFDSTGYKFILGYNFGLVPLFDLAVEGSYVNLGDESLGPVSYEESLWSGFGLAGLSFGPIGFFGKVGLANWNNEVTVGDIKTDDSGTDPAYGLGARLQFGALTGRIEYEVFEKNDNDDADMTSVSLMYTF